jgi:hypothetical protein
MMDNERETHDESRQLVQQMTERNQPLSVFESWAIQKIVAPYNAQQILDAQEWNDIPEHDRLDYNYENFKAEHPDHMDLLHGLVGGPDVSDTEPQIIDPNLVNWYEIVQQIQEEIEENRRYEQGEPATWQEQKPDPDKPGDFTLPQGWSRTITRDPRGR